jgi:hypothetical protein
MTEDQVQAALVEMARGTFPDILDADVRVSFAESAAFAAFQSALEDDPVLSVFAPPEQPFVNQSLGHGWLVQEGMLPVALALSAARLHVAAGLESQDDDAYVKTLENVLRSYRAAIGGAVVDATVVVGIEGLTIGAGRVLDTPWGRLRAASALEREIRPSRLAPTAILTFTTPVRLAIGAESDDLASQGHDRGALGDAVSRVALLLPLAALLAHTDRDEYVVPAVVWASSVAPGELGSVYFAANRGGAGGSRGANQNVPVRDGGVPLSEDEEKALIQWCTLVGERYDPVLEIAVTRTMRALVARYDEADSLIDALIAAESLFGHGGSAETGSRVASALAILLEPEVRKRRAYRAALGKVYRTRSSVVHGAEVDGRELSEDKEAALRADVLALRALFAEHPSLIVHRDRGERLILGDVDES